MIEEAIAEGRRLAHENRLEGKDLDELDELEDEEDEDFLNAYRQQRMQELRGLSKKAVHGSVYPLAKPEYNREVTEASKADSPDGVAGAGVPVLVHLTSSVGTNIESRVLSELWRMAAAEYGEVKFCEMRAQQAIEGYPERNCPTILVYRNGDIVKQVVTLAMLKGVKTNMQDVDALLVEVGAVPDTDMRVLKRRRAAEDAEDERLAGTGTGTGTSTIRTGYGGRPADDGDDDDDWD